MIQTLALSAALIAAMSGCSPKDETAGANRVTAFAAASLVTALDAIVKDFESATGAEVTVSYAASAMLAQQIASGADADVFISASLEWADEVANTNAILRREDVLGNSLVLVAPKENPAKITTPQDLASDRVKRIAIGEPESVPAGKYAREALTSLEIWDVVQPKMVYTMDVRQALLYAERGEVDAAVVYSTDAAEGHDIVTIARLDDALAAPVRYALVLLESTPPNETAAAFFAHLLSDEAAARFTAAGFERLPDSAAVTE